jgi:predicted RNA-binding Zn-ribbon protein involved in translation (DUF1610 family)
MQPEISHRCESCGASIREQAMFCPECGQALTQASADTRPPANEQTPAPVLVDNAAAQSPATPLDAANVATDNPPAVEVEPAKTEAGDPAMNFSAAPVPVSKHGTYEKARDSLHRASTATRGALADNVKRVDKIRHVSTAMFEEASYDPSLRFVLVALGLFVVFLVLLLLSKVMG